MFPLHFKSSHFKDCLFLGDNSDLLFESEETATGLDLNLCCCNKDLKPLQTRHLPSLQSYLAPPVTVLSFFVLALRGAKKDPIIALLQTTINRSYWGADTRKKGNLLQQLEELWEDSCSVIALFSLIVVLKSAWAFIFFPSLSPNSIAVLVCSWRNSHFIKTVKPSQLKKKTKQTKKQLLWCISAHSEGEWPSFQVSATVLARPNVAWAAGAVDVLCFWNQCEIWKKKKKLCEEQKKSVLLPVQCK